MSDNCVEFAPVAACSFESSPALSVQCWAPTESVVCSTPTVSTDNVAAAAATPRLELYAGDNNAAKATTSIDSSKTVAQMVQDGSMVKSDKPAVLEQKPVAEGEQPRITVSKDSGQPADFIVRKDGKVEVVGDPESGSKPHADYRIKVEDGADAKVTDELVSYLNNKIRESDSKFQPTLQADEGLVSDAVKNMFAKPEDKVPDELPEELDPDRSPPSPDCGPGPGPGPNTDVDPNDQIEPDKGDGNLDPEKSRPTKAPVEVLRESIKTSTYDNGKANELGAYNCNYLGWVGSFLTDEMLAELGTPPDMKKLGKVLAKYKNDPKFQAKMAEHTQNLKDQGDTGSAEKIEGMFNRLSSDEKYAADFGNFLEGQKAGTPATKEELAQFFDPKMQDAVASSKMADAAKEMGVNLKNMNEQQAGEVALAILLGHKPTDTEKQTYGNYVSTITDNFKRLNRS